MAAPGRRACPLRLLRRHLSQRERLWQAGPLFTGRPRPDMAQKRGPCYRGQARLRTTSPSLLRNATSPSRGGFGSPRKVNGFARGSPTRGAVERSETERLYEGKPDREPPQRRFTQVSGNTAAPRGAGYLAKFRIISVSSSQIKLRQGGELRVSWRSSNFANQGNFAKLANNQY